jgi:hypothetical protein
VTLLGEEKPITIRILEECNKVVEIKLPLFPNGKDIDTVT